ncbi:hypothetical protein MUU72_10555 [Streptomyces sp. RS10V-4]|uniref:rhomboid-like protein n=1 Tax=Streptomyces rhizoryzae TaxID=2932493 RepID=UPI002006CD4B|nr:rhomboid-like protein [Streptomyces rhizoryzae]MCK7623528.1 hypothetical protein [Streptomyces rhizoryzae]
MVAIRVRNGGGRRGALPWAAPLYVAALQAGAYATARLPAPRRTELLRTHSTNAANLGAGRWGTLATSAAFVEEPLPAAYAAALLAALATAEVRWGTARTAAVFAAGHVGASLLVYAGLRARARWRGDGARRSRREEAPRREERLLRARRAWRALEAWPLGVGAGRAGAVGAASGAVGVVSGARPVGGIRPEGEGRAVDGRRAGAGGRPAPAGPTAHRISVGGAGAPDGTAHALDVGASYGFCAVLGALGMAVRRPGVRVAVVGGLVGLGVAPVVRRGRTFTDAGHLAALVLGVAAGAARNGIRGRFPATGRNGAPPVRTATPVR